MEPNCYSSVCSSSYQLNKTYAIFSKNVNHHRLFSYNIQNLIFLHWGKKTSHNLNFSWKCWELLEESLFPTLTSCWNINVNFCWGILMLRSPNRTVKNRCIIFYFFGHPKVRSWNKLFSFFNENKNKNQLKTCMFVCTCTCCTMYICSTRWWVVLLCRS